MSGTSFSLSLYLLQSRYSPYLGSLSSQPVVVVVVVVGYKTVIKPKSQSVTGPSRRGGVHMAVRVIRQRTPKHTNSD